MCHRKKRILYYQNGLKFYNCKKNMELTQMSNYKIAQQQNKGKAKNLNDQTVKVLIV